jgi:hypothetical protein
MWKEFQERCILLVFEQRQGEEKFTQSLFVPDIITGDAQVGRKIAGYGGRFGL